MEVDSQRRMGLAGATGVGVGAIVGGGILALAGVAFAATGPAALLAFALNGAIALLTALSFAEMASKFPESGGTYTFSKKVLSVEAAFAVGWVVWFASIVAAVLYAVGFAYFALVLTGDLWRAVWNDAPAWWNAPQLVTLVAVGTTAALVGHLMREPAGGGHWINLTKVLVFGVLIAGGLWALARQPLPETRAALTPFFSAGLAGLIQAMGYSFIALQGFDLVAAVAGEVRAPERNVPRAMILSLGIALAIYLPLLLVLASVGVERAESIAGAAARDPEGIVAVAAERYLGAFGYWLVIVAAVLSMFSALQANLFAASRIARAMAVDRTLPARLSRLHPRRATPVAAVGVTGLLVCLLLLVLPDVSAAGAASSLIFLITFALAHGIAILVRLRSARRPPPFRNRLFPLVPVVGGLACIGLAVFQGIAVPAAGIITVIWLGIGAILFLGLFARRARVIDAFRTARDPELVTLRGRSPLVLVPVANPRSVEAMIALADALVPAEVGRVLVQNVAVASSDWRPSSDAGPIEKSEAVLREVLRASAEAGVHVETLTTIAPRPMREIARVAELHRCESVLLGLSELSQADRGSDLESLLGALDTNVVVLRSRPDWHLGDVSRILIPMGGRGGHEHLLARLLGSLSRVAPREVTFLCVLPENTSPEEARRAERDLRRLAVDEVREPSRVEVVLDDHPLEAVARRAEEADLLILGVQRHGPRKKLFGQFTRELARRTTCPLMVMSRRG